MTESQFVEVVGQFRAVLGPLIARVAQGILERELKLDFDKEKLNKLDKERNEKVKAEAEKFKAEKDK